MPYFLALDAGGTKTECWIGDEERVLGRAATGTVKLMNVSEEAATQRLHEVIKAAAENAGVRLDGVKCTCMGIAGVSIEAVRHWANDSVRKLVPGEFLLHGDEAIALDAAFRGGPGVLAISGTGSYIAGRCSDGTYVTAGGWGPVVGDEGAGSWIGLNAIRAAFKAYDRGKKTLLLDRICSAWDLRSVGELIAKANANRRPDFAALTLTVAECAAEGDEVAREVLRQAGRDLGEQVELVMIKMQACGCAIGDSRRVAFTGSVISHLVEVREAMRTYLHARHPDLQIAEQAVEPLEGAMWLARGGATS